jgi:hypothetical protein
MLKVWWNAVKTWSENNLKSALKNTPHFSGLFLQVPILGKAAMKVHRMPHSWHESTMNGALSLDIDSCAAIWREVGEEGGGGGMRG